MSPSQVGPGRELSDVEMEAVSRYLSGTLGDAERRAFEARVLEDPEWARVLYHQQALALALDDAGRGRRGLALPARRRPWTAWPRSATMLAAAAAIAVVAGVSMLWPRPERLRGPASEMRLIEPTGQVPVPPSEFRWSRHPDASQYRFELWEVDGRRVHAALTADTTIRLPVDGSGPPVPPAGSWRVVPLSPGGQELPAPPAVSFRSP